MANSTKKILFISYDGLTDPLGQSQVIPYLAGLTKWGYEFVILSCDKPEKFSSKKEYVEQLIAPFPIQWVSIPYHRKPPVLSSVYDFFKLRQKAKQLHAIHHFDMTHTRVGLPQLVGLHMKKKLGVKFLNDIRGFWADERVDGGMWNLKNPIYRMVYRFFRKKEDEFIRVADYNTCLTYKAKEIILNWKHLPQPVKVAVVPCSADLDLFDPATVTADKKLAIQQSLGIEPNDFIVSYLGSIGGWYLTREMMQFCRLLLDKKPNAKFLFISNNRHEVVVQEAAAFGIPADRVIVKMGKRHEVPLLLSCSHFSLFFIKPCFSKLSSSPTKHGEIMAMGIPVISNSGVGDVKEIIEKYKAGYVLDDFDLASMQSIVDAICSNKMEMDAAGIRAGAIDFYSLDKTLDTYHELYQIIMGL